MRKSKEGQATLAFVLLVSGIIIEIAIAGSAVTYFLSTSGFGEKLSTRALAAAHAGVRDVQLKISRNKEFGANNYPLAVGSDSANVTTVWSTDVANDNYTYTVTSIGTASTRQRKLVAIMVVNQTTGFLQLQSLIEQPLQ
ncbi:hypothetical protein HY967_02085 [Candidatus Jorgensenbacteria bacterium]|nr:hypothetical protein [Candidatus Jorgensenbacteria bacterium]